VISEPLVTERLLLRRFTLDDVEALYQLVTIPEVIRYVGNSPLASREATREMMKANALRDYEVHGFGRFAVVWKESGAVIGFCGVKHLDEIDENELGYRYLPEFWGRGLAKESCRAVIAHARETLRLPRLISVIHPENEGSKNVVRKLGFIHETTRVLDSLIKGQPMEIYARKI
jgi:RimJ/RimL family protein N-acetyltransferase